MIPKWSQNRTKSGPNRFQRGLERPLVASWTRNGFQDRLPQFDPAIPPVRPGHFGLQNRSKIDLELVQNGFESESQNDFETNSLSRPILDRFLIDFEAAGSKFLIEIERLCFQVSMTVGISEFLKNV